MKYKRAAFLEPGEHPVAFSLALVAKDQELIRTWLSRWVPEWTKPKRHGNSSLKHSRLSWGIATSAR